MIFCKDKKVAEEPDLMEFVVNKCGSEISMSMLHWAKQELLLY